MVFAVTVAVATPEALVVAVVETMLAPVPGPAKVTVTPLSRLLPASFTVTDSGVAKAVFTVALCPPPEFTVTEAAGPGVLVNAGMVVLTLPAVAVTV